jgi:hypothetical protein
MIGRRPGALLVVPALCLRDSAGNVKACGRPARCALAVAAAQPPGLDVNEVGAVHPDDSGHFGQRRAQGLDQRRLPDPGGR